MAGKPMAHRKSTPEGRAERLALQEFPDIDRHLGARRVARTKPDDVLDAFAAAWSARRQALGTAARLGGDLDRRGLRMEMIV
jgi:predicted RNase H-like nuclease